MTVPRMTTLSGQSSNCNEYLYLLRNKGVKVKWLSCCRYLMALVTASEEPEWLALLRSRKKLDRERGLSQLKAVLDTECLEEDEKNKLESCIFGLFSSPAAPWEEKHGGLMAAVVLVPTASERFCDLVKGEIPLLLEHQESRIRLTAGQLLAYHSKNIRPFQLTL